jgi:hypothetical protein
MSEPCPECGDYRFICDSAMGQGIARLTGRKIGKHGCWHAYPVHAPRLVR